MLCGISVLLRTMTIKIVARMVWQRRYLLFRSMQISYLQPIITQYFIDNKSEIWLLFLIAHSKR